MKCKRIRELMGAYLYGDLAADEMRQIRLHAQDCALCGDDLRSRGAVMNFVPRTAPELTETDRQRITWSVRGAIQAKERERPGLAPRLAPAFALVSVLAIGIGLGVFVGMVKDRPASSRSAVRRAGPQPAPAVVVTRRDRAPIVPEQLASPDQTADRADSEPEKAPAVRSPVRLPIEVGVSGVSSRAKDRATRKRIIKAESPLPIAPEPAEQPLVPDTDVKELPKPPEVEDSETTPPTE